MHDSKRYAVDYRTNRIRLDTDLFGFDRRGAKSHITPKRKEQGEKIANGPLGPVKAGVSFNDHRCNVLEVVRSICGRRFGWSVNGLV